MLCCRTALMSLTLSFLFMFLCGFVSHLSRLLVYKNCLLLCIIFVLLHPHIALFISGIKFLVLLLFFSKIIFFCEILIFIILFILSVLLGMIVKNLVLNWSPSFIFRTLWWLSPPTRQVCVVSQMAGVLVRGRVALAYWDPLCYVAASPSRVPQLQPFSSCCFSVGFC